LSPCRTQCMTSDCVSKRVSRRLSFILRHDPGSVGLSLDAAGWMAVGDLLAALRLTREQIDEIVATDGKKRFEYSADGAKIRASQGHSVDVDLGYDERTPPAVLYHGTSMDVAESIRASGLDRRARHHVHLSADHATAQVVAHRRPRPMILRVMAEPMHAAGHKFYLSTNGVWLTEVVPPAFIEWP
jgi:putative RNA 2'-phosphotransferase